MHRFNVATTTVAINGAYFTAVVVTRWFASSHHNDDVAPDGVAVDTKSR